MFALQSLKSFESIPFYKRDLLLVIIQQSILMILKLIKII